MYIRPTLLRGIWFLFLVALLLPPAGAQDISEEQEEVITEVERPYLLALKLRPLSYLLYPITFGEMNNFNGEAEIPFHRAFALAVGVNHFYADFDLQTGPDSINHITMTSFRIDPKVYVSALRNKSRFGSGFFIGPYLKYRYQYGSFSNSTVSIRGSFWMMLYGVQAGVQFRKNRLLISPSAGVGYGVRRILFFTDRVLDIRMGLSIGVALF